MKSVDEMIHTNKTQAEFYDSIQREANRSGAYGYSRNKAANVVTRVWAHLRKQQQKSVQAARVDQILKRSVTNWAQEKTGGQFLEIGCFAGSAMTFDLIKLSGSYTGIELSSEAVKVLQSKIADLNVSPKANIVCGDFLTMDEATQYDLIYAHGVLHHFENPEPMFEKIQRLLKPNGLLIFVEASGVNPTLSFVRSLYRPFQSDRAWEWPFTHNTVQVLERLFQHEAGFGWGQHSLFLTPLLLIPLLGPVLQNAYVWIVNREVNKGWHDTVWHNSSVAAAYRVKR